MNDKQGDDDDAMLVAPTLGIWFDVDKTYSIGLKSLRRQLTNTNIDKDYLNEQMKLSYRHLLQRRNKNFNYKRK